MRHCPHVLLVLKVQIRKGAYGYGWSLIGEQHTSILLKRYMRTIMYMGVYHRAYCMSAEVVAGRFTPCLSRGLIRRSVSTCDSLKGLSEMITAKESAFDIV
jgi:hypothetical protein